MTTSPVAAFILLLTAFASSYFLAKKSGRELPVGRFSTIDGLRGYLAFFVLLHHSGIWYFYLHSGTWSTPPSRLYTHFGESSVALFFMITGFLFISKLINARSSPIDWGRLFISRFLRIAPLYFFCIVLLLIIVAILSKGRVNEPILTLIQEVMHWIGFTTLRQADINGLKNTFTITAGATWSIPYEWIFYLLLPGIACFYRLRPSPRVLLMSVAGVLIAIAAHAALKFLGIFLGGLIAALLVKSDKFCQFATKKIASYICILCIITTISCFNSAYHLIPFGLLTVTFSLIAGGNSLFGAMLNKTSRTLGEFAYSIYLIHGIVLFITFNFIIGLPVAATLSPTAHWAIIWAITPVLIGISAITFRFIEYPSIQSTTAIINYLRK